MEIVLITAGLPLICGLVSAVVLMTTFTRPYLGYACVCLSCLFVYSELQGFPKPIPINASQKLFCALLIAAPAFWVLQRRSPCQASATIAFAMGIALLGWLLWPRLHFGSSIFHILGSGRSDCDCVIGEGRRSYEYRGYRARSFPSPSSHSACR